MAKHTGFTLIELMIVIAILGILLAISIPVYQSYVIRAKISEGLYMSAPAKTAVSLTRQTTNQWPDTNQESGLAITITSHYVSALNVINSGVIQVVMQNIHPHVDGKSILLTPSQSSSGAPVEWNCGTNGANPLPERYVPASCR